MDLSTAEELLRALGAHLRASGCHDDLVVCGGVGLQALGAVVRTTKDVDVVARVSGGHVRPVHPLSEELERARARVARDFGLPENWLDERMSAQLEHGMPAGWIDRLVTRSYDGLVVHYLGRLDQIHLKLYALADNAPGSRHDGDLRALKPTRDELIEAVRWLRAQDPSDGFRVELVATLEYLGVSGAAELV